MQKNLLFGDFQSICSLLSSYFFYLLVFNFSLICLCRSLGLEVYLSVQEADCEIARFARQHGCMGILGQDSDFIIYDRCV